MGRIPTMGCEKVQVLCSQFLCDWQSIPTAGTCILLVSHDGSELVMQGVRTGHVSTSPVQGRSFMWYQLWMLTRLFHKRSREIVRHSLFVPYRTRPAVDMREGTVICSLSVTPWHYFKIHSCRYIWSFLWKLFVIHKHWYNIQSHIPVDILLFFSIYIFIWSVFFTHVHLHSWIMQRFSTTVPWIVAYLIWHHLPSPTGYAPQPWPLHS